MLSIDSGATAEKMETRSFARWVEGHKKFVGIPADAVTELAYAAVLYRCQKAEPVLKPKGNPLSNEWYTKVLENEKEVWVESRNGNIFEGGINENPKPWNPDTGLKKQ